MHRKSALLSAALLSLAAAGCGRRAGNGPVVVSAIGTTPRIADSARPLDLPSALLTDATAQGLVRLDAAGQLEPGLAERWTVIDNGATYIFRLADTTWQDGRPVTATEVVALLRRAATRPHNPLTPFFSAVEQIRAMTPQVIEIDLKRPRPDFLRLLAQPEMALVGTGKAGGTGPMEVKRRTARGSAIVAPRDDPDRDADEDTSLTPSDDVVLIGERTSLALLRFVAHQSDLVTGGTFLDWPLVAAADPPSYAVQRDPAVGLFGLAVVRREGFLADSVNRDAVSEAIDRAAALSAIAPEWPGTTTILPDQLDSAGPPVQPAWAGTPLAARREDARRRIAAWRAATKSKEPIELRIALPAGPGANRLYGAIGGALLSIGITPTRVALDDPTADLRLVDAVSPVETARWYLVRACQPCGEEATAAIEAARLAATPADRAATITAAVVALTRDAAFIPLAQPLRWSLVDPGLDQWQPNARAWHPLTHLRSPPS
ncbi:MAG: ABC transporter substrate-binding protein [Sphingomonas sp.]